jgi:hypothetical protein
LYEEDNEVEKNISFLKNMRNENLDFAHTGLNAFEVILYTKFVSNRI